MNQVQDIQKFTRLQKIISIFQFINQISWTSNQTRKRYPNPEVMTDEEINALTKAYIALGFDIEIAYKNWLKEYKEYKKDEVIK